ncbi:MULTISPECIES: DNA polymerase III subunit beta [Cytobacillus]|uniref:Beta sliding clamp n=1 Tax=Cytobacillus oceanisediminis TaxID=665099 RepID=A0ABX3CMW3_9BACI|nr:DNA polymerase III subunit beta [Cytobacillus oceanisediminis]EFV74952.1 DNA polymerase III [Bacillus sp. 2_A_57_CT2]OHX44573.1 DNA polymerase III subunit beta [Cytobacillus oceanisediminis]
MTSIKIKETKALIDLLGKASAAASNKPDSIRSGIMIVAKKNEITIRAANETISVQLNAKDITEANEDLIFVVPAKLFLDMMKKLPKGEVVIIVEDKNVIILVGKSSYGISTLAIDEFPKPVAYEEGKIFQVEGPEFAQSLSAMIHACSDSETRPILTGVHIVSNGKYLTLIATDSHRLMATAVPILKETEEFKNVVVPKTSIKELTTLLTDEKEVEFSISDNQLSLKTDGVLFTTRLLEGSFPDVTKLIPTTYESEVVVHREEFLKALDRTKTALGKSGKVALFHVMEGTLPTFNIECKTEITNVFEELFIDEAGASISIKLDVYFLTDCLQSINSQKVRLQIAGTMKPMLIRPEIQGATQFGLVLPVR